MIEASNGIVRIDGTKEETFEELKAIIDALYETGYTTPDFIRAIKEVMDLGKGGE